MNSVGWPTTGSALASLSSRSSSALAFARLSFACVRSRRMRVIGPPRTAAVVEK